MIKRPDMSPKSPTPDCLIRPAATIDLGIYNKSSAGSGTLASPSQSEIREGNISNPRVLSDMGLAIPRPTRLLPALAGLGDPRNSLLLSVSRISVALLNCCVNDGKLFGPLQRSCNNAAALRLCSSSRRSLRFNLQRIYRCWDFVNWRVLLR